MLTGDVGGTNSRMALYGAASSIPLCVKYYRNEEHIKEKKDGIFEAKIIAPFLQHCWDSVKGLEPIDWSEIVACLAIAGPVRDNRVQMSNLKDIVIDGHAIETGMFCEEIYVKRIKVCKVINDFVAQGYGCLTLKPNEMRELTPGSHAMTMFGGPKVCVGAGTGLGECFLTPNGRTGTYSCFPSEGGHVEFNPRSELEIKMRAYMMKRFGREHRLSAERVVSGPGLGNVYDFLVSEFPEMKDDKMHEEFLKAPGDSKGKFVSENAKEGTLFHQAMAIAMAAYGSEVGSTAIKFIPTGGLFVTGGLTPKNIHFIEGPESEFMKAYRDKGRVGTVLDYVPLFAVMVEDLGVRGALHCCKEAYEELKRDDSTPVEEVPVVPVPDGTVAFFGPTFLVVSTIIAVLSGVLLGRRLDH